MGDMAEDFKVMKEWKQDIRKREEPKRIQYAIDHLKGYSYKRSDDFFLISVGKYQIQYWAYTGWYQAKKPYGKIKGRGVHRLIKALETIK